MASFNKVMLAGNLTRDPELRYTPQGLDPLHPGQFHQRPPPDPSRTGRPLRKMTCRSKKAPQHKYLPHNFLCQKLKLFSFKTSSAWAPSPTTSKSPPATPGTTSFP